MHPRRTSPEISASAATPPPHPTSTSEPASNVSTYLLIPVQRFAFRNVHTARIAHIWISRRGHIPQSPGTKSNIPIAPSYPAEQGTVIESTFHMAFASTGGFATRDFQAHISASSIDPEHLCPRTSTDRWEGSRE